MTGSGNGSDKTGNKADICSDCCKKEENTYDLSQLRNVHPGWLPVL